VKSSYLRSQRILMMMVMIMRLIRMKLFPLIMMFVMLLLLVTMHVVSMVMIIVFLLFFGRRRRLCLGAGHFRFFDRFWTILEMWPTAEESFATYGVSLRKDTRCLATVARATYRSVVTSEHHSPVRIRTHGHPFLSQKHYRIAVSIQRDGNCK